MNTQGIEEFGPGLTFGEVEKAVHQFTDLDDKIVREAFASIGVEYQEGHSYTLVFGDRLWERLLSELGMAVPTTGTLQTGAFVFMRSMFVPKDMVLVTDNTLRHSWLVQNGAER